MQIKLLKFTVVHNGVRYQAGSVMDLPEKDANKLLAEGIAAVLEQEKTAAQKATQVEMDFSSMTVAELKHYCAENGIGVGKTKKKADLLAIIAERDNENSLPSVDYKAVVV